MIIDTYSEPGYTIVDLEDAEVLQIGRVCGVQVRACNPAPPGPYSDHGILRPIALRNVFVITVPEMTFWMRVKLAWRILVRGSLRAR